MRQQELTAILALAAALFATHAAEAQDAKPAAQNAAPPNIRYIEVENRDLTVPGIELTVEQLEELDIVNASGKRIGGVDEVLSSADGTIVAIATEVGGFLGIGDRKVILSLDQIRLQDGRLATQLTDAQLKALPAQD
ncbi:MAG: PRC-barrel domain-containing protein [Sneathiellaceae bacterium]